MTETDISVAAGALEVPCELYDEKEKCFQKFGKGLPGDTVQLKYTERDGKGHCGPLDPNIQVVTSGENNCVLDAILAQLSPDKRKALKLEDGNDIRKVMEKYVLDDHTEVANKAYKIHDRLENIAPDALRRGGITEWFNPEYWKALSEGNKEKIAEIEALHQGIEIAVVKLSFIAGVSITVGMTPAGILGAIAAGSAISAILDKSLRQAIVSGDWKAAANHMCNHVPIVGSCKNSMEAYQKGNYKAACVFGMLAFVEGYGLAKGIKKVVTDATRATTVQNHIKQGGGRVSNQLQNTPVKIKPSGLGSTGRTVANNLNEQLTMKEVMSNPYIGEKLKSIGPLNDPRWKGWVKMRWKNPSTGVDIHYVVKMKGDKIIKVDDFKFVDKASKK